MKITIRFIYEIIWLLLSICTFVLALYDWTIAGWNKNVLYFFVLSALAFGVYLLRNSQRKREEEERKKSENGTE